jgi:hypothetical protein
LCNDALHGERSYISKDGMEGSIRHSRSDSINEEGCEEDIVEGNEEISAEENLEQNEKDYYQGNTCGNDAIYGDGTKGTNSNIVGRHKFKWLKVECDLVDDGGVFIA